MRDVGHNLEDAISGAERLCLEHDVRLTGLRRDILNILAQADGPIGAYSILDQLARARGKAVGPPTVYRTLEMLVSIGCVVKIESRNAFTLCGTPGHDHHGMMLICKRCGKADEVGSDELDRLLHATIASSGFHPERQILEVEGICGRCWAEQV